MPTQNDLRTLKRLAGAKQSSGALLATALFAVALTAAETQAPFRERLSQLPFKIAYETYVNDNWEIFVMNADGSNPINLTQTPKEQEHYPQVSPDGTNLHHLYNPCFAPNGKWVVATVHAGMGVDHGILLIATHGTNIINLKIPGCRPCLSPDGKQIAWGSGDHEIDVAPIDLDSDSPAVGSRRLRIQDKTNETYHVDWPPNSRFPNLSR